MTTARASAYQRVVRALRDLGPTSLHAPEMACFREAADALLFCRDLATDPEAQAAYADVAALIDFLVDAERWSERRADRLLDDIWACGPPPAAGAVAA
jgi:hypothetical protein